MGEPLALKYRPTTFAEMVGQRLNAVVLNRMVETGNIPNGFLFSGPSGTGKTTSARILASSLGTETIEIDAASNGGVADVRALIESLRYSTGSAYRVVILDEAHSMTKEAFNALLKTLEEPPAGTIIVLVTTEPEKVPLTVLSRLIEFEFRRITPSEILDRLVVIAQAESIDITLALLQRISEDSDGNLRTAVMRLEQVSIAQIRTVEEYIELAGITDPAPSLVAALLTGSAAQIMSVLDSQLATTGNPAYISSQIVRCLSDLWVIRAGGIPNVSGVGLELRQELARMLDLERILAGAQLLWDLKTRIRTSNDPQGDLLLALMLVSERFTRGRTVPEQTPATAPPPQAVASAQVPVPVPRKLTLAEIRQRS